MKDLAKQMNASRKHGSWIFPRTAALPTLQQAKRHRPMNSDPLEHILTAAEKVALQSIDCYGNGFEIKNCLCRLCPERRYCAVLTSSK